MEVQRTVPASAEFFDIVPFKFITPDDEAEFPYLVGIPTAGVTGEAVWFRREFWDELSPAKQRGLILHEIGHMMRADISTPFTDPSVPTDVFHMRCNIAQDLAIEAWIHTEFNSEQQGHYISQNHAPELFAPYIGWSWMDIYRDLVKRGEGGGGMGTVDSHIPGALPAGMQQDIARAKKLSDARQRGEGDIHSGHRAAGDAPVVNWRNALRNMWQKVDAPAYASYVRPSRRGMARGCIAPRMVGTRNGIEHINIWVDISGSMSEVLPTVLTDVMRLANGAMIKKACIYFYNTRVVKVQQVDTSTPLRLNKVPFGGGTSFDGAFRGTPPTGKRAPMVVLTDGGDEYATPPEVVRKHATSAVVLCYGGAPQCSFAPVLQVN
jgi:predicted metal-dependent peptidase